MTTDAATAPPTPRGISLEDLPPADDVAAALRGAGLADVRHDATTRAVYSSDASLYRAQPLIVAMPRHTDEMVAALSVCRALRVPLTVRGAGTSIAGNAIGHGVVLDVGRYLNKVLSVDAETRTATVEPGTVHATLQAAARPTGLRFGPDPSTHTRCTIGGMIGNNACGARALGYGRTVDNVMGLDVLLGTGTRLRLDSTGAAGREADALRAIVGGALGDIRTECGTFTRQVSGYSLEHLVPERDFDLRRFMVGSEGTLGLVLGATMRLVSDPVHSITVALGYADIGAAGDAVPDILEFSPTACEGLDKRIVDVVVSRKGPGAVPDLPAGSAWVLVELSGDDELEVADRAARLAAGAGALEARVIADQRAALTLWRIREDGSGLAGRSAKGLPAHSGWEDAAVPPARLGEYLRAFDELTEQFGITGFPYGHFGDGCVHIRLDYPFHRPEGLRVYREFLTEATRLVARFGGSCSGEHGDGRARSELLPLMYSPTIMSTFAAVKNALDPDDVLNPGVLVRPAPLDRDVRVAAAPPVRVGRGGGELAFRWSGDDGDFSQAVHRCTGVAKCRADTLVVGGVMCPSYQATKEDKDSTRGRARALQEMLAGPNLNRQNPNWRDPAVHSALELCLSCKGCHSDCPTGTDMAAFKSEVLHQSYRGRLRPLTHYSLGRLPLWTRLVGKAPALLGRIANTALKVPGLRSVALAGAGVDARRGIPTFAYRTFRQWWDAEGHREPAGIAPGPGGGAPVMLWVDSFTDAFAPATGVAAVAVLRAAGYSVQIPRDDVCCGLTWITTGQLDTAKRMLTEVASSLGEAAAAGIPIVGLEPSCTAVLRGDAVELLGEDVAGELARSTRTLAELLNQTPGWTPPDLAGTTVVAQPHCHHHAVMGWAADAALLEAAGAEVTRLGGCCGLAGNFGVERGHYEVSVAVAEHQLLPALRDAPLDAVILADGFSCRTQITDLTGPGRQTAHLPGGMLARREPVSLAELLASRLPVGPPLT